MKKKPQYYTIRKRKDCDRWELQIRGQGAGLVYGGLHKSKREAEQAARDVWGLNIPRKFKATELVEDES